jgi:hypothetical protein
MHNADRNQAYQSHARPKNSQSTTLQVRNASPPIIITLVCARSHWIPHTHVVAIIGNPRGPLGSKSSHRLLY